MYVTNRTWQQHLNRLDSEETRVCLICLAVSLRPRSRDAPNGYLTGVKSLKDCHDAMCPRGAGAEWFCFEDFVVYDKDTKVFFFEGVLVQNEMVSACNGKRLW
jgi:hypothetical protein